MSAASTLYDKPTGSAAPQSKERGALAKLRSHLDQRIESLRSDRMSWWTHWRELADYLLPRRYKWLITPNQGNRGSPINQKIINNTGTIALRVLSAGMMSGLTSPSKPWFRLTTGNDELDADPDVKQWLDEVRTRMERVFAESNFYNALAVLYQDLGAFGTGVMVIYEDFEDVIHCTNACAGEYFLANGRKGTVETFAREFVLTTLQIAEEFGLDNASVTVQTSIDTSGAQLVKELKVGHVIEPNIALLPDTPGVTGMPWRETYWERGTGNDKILRSRGFQEQPFIAARWDVFANDAYGRSPGMDALGDIKALQVMEKRKGQALDKHVNPPMLADITLKNEPASLISGGVTYTTNIEKGGMRPIHEVAPDFTGLVADISKVEMRIQTTFYRDLFLMISDLETVRTATEIDARKEEKLIQLGPVLERFENEALDPAVFRTFSIMNRGGLLPPAPPAMRGRMPRVEYVSMLAVAQRAVSTSAIERLMAFVGNLTAGDRSALDNVDIDETVDQYADLLGVSPKLIRSTISVTKLRAARQKAMQQQIQDQQTMAAVQGAQTLSQTDVGGGQNALQRMLGNAQ